jgi:hypothetical protein
MHAFTQTMMSQSFALHRRCRAAAAAQNGAEAVRLYRTAAAQGDALILSLISPTFQIPGID